MNKKKFPVENRTIVVLAFFAAALLLIGLVLRSRIGVLAVSYTEGQTEKQAQAYALVMSEKLGTEIENLEYISNVLEKSLDNIDDLMPRIYAQPGIKQGLIGIDGEALYGEKVDAGVYEGIQDSFRGNPAISYVEDEGLLFTCPVFHGPNIRYVLYRLCPYEILDEYFATDIYEDLGKICVIARDGNIVIPFYNSEKEDVEWYKSEDIQKKYASMHMEMEVSVATAKRFQTRRGDMVLFEAEIPGTDYLISGFVPLSVASKGIGNITILVVWVFGLLMVLVMIGAFYLTRMSIKARESDELRIAKAQAEEASRAKSDFLANMSHEIRTPINAVLGMNEMIIRESRDETINGYASNIKAAGATLLGIINDILDFSKIEAGKIEIIPVDYDLSEMLYELVTMIRVRADEKSLFLKLDFDSEIPRMLNGDEVRIKQIITNILTNAVKYTEKGSITFSIGYEKVQDHPDEILLKVSVQDTGIGIRQEDLEKLFTEFERIEEKRNRNIEGTGLGMNITKNLLEKMGSQLDVSSEYGKGSVFSFKLKQIVTGSEKLGDFEVSYREHAKDPAAHREKFRAPLARILVVDDNYMNLVVFKSLIKETGIVTDSAESGDEGIALTASGKYDIIFLDHMMPQKDGIETLAEIRADAQNPNQASVIVCLTANAIAGARQEYLDAGFDDYLTKPIDPDKLEEMILKYLPQEKVEWVEEGETAKEDDSNSDDETAKRLKLLEGSPIDTQKGIKNNGDAESYMTILKIFYDSIESKSREIEELYSSGDIKNYTIRVHALKSSARIIRAEEFGEKGQLLENAGKGNDIDYIRNNHESFMKAYMGFKEILEPVCCEEEAEDKIQADRSDMEEAYNKLKQAAEDMDCNGLEDIFNEYDKFSIPEEDRQLWNSIKEAAERFEYDSITSLLENRHQ